MISLVATLNLTKGAIIKHKLLFLSVELQKIPKILWVGSH